MTTLIFNNSRKGMINRKISCVRTQYIDLHQEKVYLCIKCT